MNEKTKNYLYLGGIVILSITCIVLWKKVQDLKNSEEKRESIELEKEIDNL